MIISDMVSTGQSANEEVHIVVEIHAGMSWIRLGHLKCARFGIGYSLDHQAANVANPAKTHCSSFSKRQLNIRLNSNTSGLFMTVCVILLFNIRP